MARERERTEYSGEGAAAQAARQAQDDAKRPEYGDRTPQEFLQASVKQFESSYTWESEDRAEALEDDQFKLGGRYQWPEYAQRTRRVPGQERPMFTLNEISKFTNHVINEIRQNRPQIKVLPVDDDADPKTAEVFTELIRHIFANGQGDWPQDWAVEQAIDGGWGYLRVRPRYLNDETNEQELTVEAVFNRFNVYPDHRAVTPWLEDMEYCFISKWKHRDELPEMAGEWSQTSIGDRNLWLKDEEIRVVEKYWLGPKKRITVQEKDGNGGMQDVQRDSVKRDVWWAEMTASMVVDGPRKMPGRWIPVVRVLGSLQSVEGRPRKKGLIRDAKDPQRIVNFEWTDSIERTALGVKVGAVGAEGAFEGHEQAWREAMGGQPIATLEYRPVPIQEGNRLVLAPPPQLTPMPDPPTGAIAMMQLASEGLRESIGLFDASLGQRGPEKSGRAIVARQQQGGTATYHYQDNLNYSNRHLGRILVDLIPHFYDTARKQRILGEDGNERMVQLMPDLTQAGANGDADKPLAYREGPVPEGETGERLEARYRLDVGAYDVRVSTGRSFATRQQEAIEGMANILSAVGPEGAMLVMPELFQAMDWPGADKIAELFARHRDQMFPHLREQEEGDEVAAKEQVGQLQQLVQELVPMMQEMQQQMQGMAAELQDREADRMVDLFKAKMAMAAEFKESETNVIVEMIRSAMQQAALGRQQERAQGRSQPRDGGGGGMP